MAPTVNDFRAQYTTNADNAVVERALAYAVRLMRTYVPETVRESVPIDRYGNAYLSPPAASVMTPAGVTLDLDGRRIRDARSFWAGYDRAFRSLYPEVDVVYATKPLEDFDVAMVAMAVLTRDGYVVTNAAGASATPRPLTDVIMEWHQRAL